jgi:hypothetical protein
MNIYSNDITPLFMTPKDAVKYEKPFPKNAFIIEPSVEIDLEYISKLFSKYL